MQTTKSLFPFSFRKFFSFWFFQNKKKFERIVLYFLPTICFTKSKQTQLLAFFYFLLLLINNVCVYVWLRLLFTHVLIHENTSFVHSCWKTIPARRPQTSLDKITNHDELLTTNSTSWAQRVWDLYVRFFKSGTKDIYVKICYLSINIYLCGDVGV